MRYLIVLLLIFAASLAVAAGPTDGAQGADDEQDQISLDVAVSGKNVDVGVGAGKNVTADVSVGKGSSDNATSGKGVTVETEMQNKGTEIQISLQAGDYVTEDGKQLKVQLQAGERTQLQSGGASATTSLKMVQEQAQDRTKLKVQLSNGANAEVKIMPDTASETALERLRLKVCSEENGCQIELKEVSQGGEVKAAYEVQVQKEAKVLGMFKTTVRAKAQVDAESGEVIKTQKPWWASLTDETA